MGSDRLVTYAAVPETRELFLVLFGTCKHCYRCLGLAGAVGYQTFLGWWRGETVSRGTHEVVGRAFWGWRVKMMDFLGSVELKNDRVTGKTEGFLG